MLLSHISYLCSIFNIVAVYIGLLFHPLVDRIDPPRDIPSIASTTYYTPPTTVSTPISTPISTPTVVPTFTICEPSIDPFTVRESIFQALHNQSTCVTERPADHSRDHARDPPKETVAPLYLRKFVKAQVLDASGITRFGTIMVNHLKEDEAVVSHVVQRTVMMVIESPKPPSPTPTMLIGKTAVFVWIAFLYMLKLVYWVMFMYSSYWFWDKFVVQI